MLFRLLGFCVLLMLPALHPAVADEPREGTRPPPDFPLAVYQRAAAEGARIYRVDPVASQLLIHVYPEGWLAPVLGHEHIVSTRQLHGMILLPAKGPAQANVYVSVHDLQLNNPELRSRAGIKGEVTEQENARTRETMLNEVLEAERYPYIRIRIDDNASEQGRLPVTVTLHGETRQMTVPAMLNLAPDTISAEGEFDVTQTKFGIEPYSVLGGALRVADRLDITFEIVAKRLPNDPASW